MHAGPRAAIALPVARFDACSLVTPLVAWPTRAPFDTEREEEEPTSRTELPEAARLVLLSLSDVDGTDRDAAAGLEVVDWFEGIDVETPTLEAPSPTASGIVPAASRAYEIASELDGALRSRAESAAPSNAVSTSQRRALLAPAIAWAIVVATALVHVATFAFAADQPHARTARTARAIGASGEVRVTAQRARAPFAAQPAPTTKAPRTTTPKRTAPAARSGIIRDTPF